ncbi:MAG: class I SAM-dependent RNA methyltransferase [Actinomycetota bacterium]|nr:class I SAM-dependent RNA methyltransferase [Actinomycetota bacterium]
MTTTAMATDGRAVARDATGKVVFVEGALADETVAVEMTDDRSRWSSARVVDVLAASPDRVAPPCPHRAAGCGGCPWQHVDPPAQRRLKSSLVEESLRRLADMEYVPLRPTVELEPWAWRTTIKAGVIDGRPALRKGRTHDLIPVPGCLIAHPLLLPLLDGPIHPGAESVVLRGGARTGERLVATTPSRLPTALSADVQQRHYHEKAAGHLWRVSARSFFQSRADGADALADLVADAAEGMGLTSPGRAVDAYSGVGLFAGVLARHGWEVTAVEGSKAAVADARHNLGRLGVEVVGGDVTRWAAPRADLVVADPSRAGLGRTGVTSLTSTGASRIVLISCDVASMGRDTGLLTRAGYGLSAVTPVDLFPHSWRVEVVSVFDRRP